MEKPVIFFSHSSKDRDRLMPIRKRLLDGTGNAIDIFMSSDGSSIPFGRNWLKEVEDALDRCRLMFVWLTPASVKSDWIKFEAGIAYAKNIKVVPIGFDGIDLDQVDGPLKILQGFNIRETGSLNNIISIINEEFKLTFQGFFDDIFYREYVNDPTSESSPELLRYVSRIVFDFPEGLSINGRTVHKAGSTTDILQEILKKDGALFSTDSHDGTLRGSGFDVTPDSAIVDPLALNVTWPYWAQAWKLLYSHQSPRLFMTVKLQNGFRLQTETALISARLLNTEVLFDTELPQFLFRFRNIEFRVDATGHLILLVDVENVAPIPLFSLLKLLEERWILRA